MTLHDNTDTKCGQRDAVLYISQQVMFHFKALRAQSLLIIMCYFPLDADRIVEWCPDILFKTIGIWIQS